MMDFIKEINEARMTRDSSNARVLTYTDCCERLYLTVLTLELLRKYPTFTNNVRVYAKRTSGYDSYRYFRSNGTDLYNFIYYVNGDEKALNKLKDPGAAKRKRKTVTLPTMQLNGFITKLSYGQEPSNTAQLFVKLENELGIVNTDYKAIRRALGTWQGLSTTDKKKFVTKLLFACRAKLRSSDIIDDLEKLAAVRDLETSAVRDNEPTVSAPDMTIDSKDLLWYRAIVGQENLFLARKFVEMTGKGTAIPSNVVQAYAPAVKMLNDIVAAGPAYVGMLRTIHNKAKKQNK